jgi:hypothetical protein
MSVDNGKTWVHCEVAVVTHKHLDGQPPNVECQYRVAGVNSNGTGPYSNAVTVRVP